MYLKKKQFLSLFQFWFENKRKYLLETRGNNNQQKTSESRTYNFDLSTASEDHK